MPAREAADTKITAVAVRAVGRQISDARFGQVFAGAALATAANINSTSGRSGAARNLDAAYESAALHCLTTAALLGHSGGDRFGVPACFARSKR